MNSYSNDLLKAAHKHSIFHKAEVIESIQCGCFYCLATFPPNKIREWTDDDDPRGLTALCPFCGIDSVIGDKSGFPISDKNFLTQMHSFYF